MSVRTGPVVVQKDLAFLSECAIVAAATFALSSSQRGKYGEVVAHDHRSVLAHAAIDEEFDPRDVLAVAGGKEKGRRSDIVGLS